jgi:hypothetical protein
VRFSKNQNLRVGQKIQMELSWPAPLDDGTNLNLWMFGTVVRSAHVEVEVRITAYEFRFLSAGPYDSEIAFGDRIHNQSAHTPR